MSKIVDINFEKLDKCISELDGLLSQLEEPSYKSLEFWVPDTSSSGMVVDNLYRFCNNTIDFHKSVYSLIENTSTYLKEVKKIQDLDASLAEKL